MAKGARSVRLVTIAVWWPVAVKRRTSRTRRPSEAHPLFGQPIGHRLARDGARHRGEGRARPAPGRALPIGQEVEAVPEQLREEGGAPALSVKDHGDPAVRPHEAPHLGQDGRAEHREELVVGRRGDPEHGAAVGGR